MLWTTRSFFRLFVRRSALNQKYEEEQRLKKRSSWYNDQSMKRFFHPFNFRFPFLA
jgi:hypothetical protein